MRTYVYVDGFNLYYGALKGTAWKWLDLPALFAEVLQPHHDILAVKYFTARVSGTPADQSKPQRQDVYLRALQHYRREVAVYFGHFLRHTVRAPLAHPLGGTRTAEVIKTEEKGSDVNLAVHLLNDSDLAEAMRLVRHHHGKRIGLITPGTSRPSRVGPKKTPTRISPTSGGWPKRRRSSPQPRARASSSRTWSRKMSR